MNASDAHARAVAPARRWIAFSCPPSTSGTSRPAAWCSVGGSEADQVVPAGGDPSGGDGGEHGDPERPADLARGVEHAGGDARLLGRDRAHGGGAQRRHRERRADAGKGEERPDVRVRRVGLQLGEPEHADAQQRHPRRREIARADARVEPPGDRRDEQDHHRPGQRPHAGLERRVPLDVLEEQRAPVDRAEHRKADEQHHHIRHGEGTPGEELEREHRVARRGAHGRRTRPRG